MHMRVPGDICPLPLGLDEEAPLSEYDLARADKLPPALRLPEHLLPAQVQTQNLGSQVI
jgi:hypothetical protein